MRAALSALLLAALCVMAQATVDSNEPTSVGPKVIGPDDVTDTVHIRDRAGSFGELAKQAGAATTWGGRFLLWVKEGKNHQPEAFALDQAYQYVGKSKKVEWVTLEFDTEIAPYVASEDVCYTRRRAVVTPAPAPRRDAAGWPRKAAARRLLSDPAKGEVYDLAWPSLRVNGSGSWEYERRVFVLRDPKGAWHVLGECAGGSNGKNGATDYLFTSLTAQAAWTSQPEAPVQLTLTKQTEECIPTDQGAMGVSLLTHRRGTLEGRLKPTQVQWDEQELMVAQKSDTLEKMARRLAVWRSQISEDEPENPTKAVAKAVRTWSAEIRRVNPKAPIGKDGVIPAGTELIVPDTEVVSKLLASNR